MGLADTLRRLAAANKQIVLKPSHHPEPLAHLEYQDELRLKNRALARFWTEHDLPGRPEPVVAAPQPRGYRTTTKRRAIRRGGELALGFTGKALPRSGLADSALDHADHVAVYSLVQQRLLQPGADALAEVLNHVVVRGSAGALTVILNVCRFDAAIVRGAKLLADKLRRADIGVRAAQLYLDPTASDYYLEARRPAGVLSSKRLFGPDWLQVEIDDLRLRFPPTVFSQVNGAMVPVMTATAGAMLGPLDGHSLLDLYCGYGLFSFTVGRQADRVVGIDNDGPAIAAAEKNAHYLHLGRQARFIGARVDSELLNTQLQPARGSEVVLLDPPRQGTALNVASAIASRQPAQVLHLCCATDEIPREIAAWTRAGLTVRRVVPLDLFAGTANLETLILLAP